MDIIVNDLMFRLKPFVMPLTLATYRMKWGKIYDVYYNAEKSENISVG